MECAGCNFENRERAKFCKNCGAKLDLVCPSCGHPCESDSSFCDECGHDLKGPRAPFSKELSFDEKLAKIQKYFPSSLIEKILAQRDPIGARPCSQMMFHLGRNYVPQAEPFKRKADLPKAKKNLIKAIEIFKDCGADGWVTKAQRRNGKRWTSNDHNSSGGYL